MIIAFARAAQRKRSRMGEGAQGADEGPHFRTTSKNWSRMFLFTLELQIPYKKDEFQI